MIPPQVVILSVEHTKVSRQPDAYGTTTVTFTFTEPVFAWALRINSTDAYDGLQVAGAEVEHRGFGRGRFGRMPFGRWEHDSAHLIADGEAMVSGDSLLEGANDVAVYALTAQGWTVRT